jgi:SAM-dependent MidA family methyltransferase
MRFSNPSLNLPEPSPEEHSQSIQVDAIIKQAIAQEGGHVTLARFMEIALYEPGLGYYVSGNRIFGEGGDFVTAPELTPLFSYCLARQIQQVFTTIGNQDVLEFGAGSGVMAKDVLNELQRLDCLPDNYYILEVSPSLQQRQRETIAQHHPELIERVSWIERLPESFRGVVLANEVIDAMPVHRVRFRQNGEHEELYVSQQQGEFVWRTGPPSSGMLASKLNYLFEQFPDLTDGYETEINLNIEPWTRSLSDMLQTGLIIIIDYGFPQREFFHAQRFQGTLMCHYKHRAHEFPLILPGIQDVTSHVDFTAVAEAAFEAGLNVSGFTAQANFLVGCGIESMLAEFDPTDIKKFMSQAQPVKKLLLPNEMGELFKVIGLTRNLDIPLIGFSTLDQRGRL